MNPPRATPDYCAGCPYRSYGPAVGSSGDPDSPIVVVGEAPGAIEIAEGRPFVGPAGKLLGGALSEAGLNIEDLLILNSLACLPSPVRPRVAAIDACRGRLIGEIGAHARRVVIALGGTAIRAVTDRRAFRVQDIRGRITRTTWAPVVPTLHPARILRRRSERPLLVSDLRLAFRLATSEQRARPALSDDD